MSNGHWSDFTMLQSLEKLQYLQVLNGTETTNQQKLLTRDNINEASQQELIE